MTVKCPITTKILSLFLIVVAIFGFTNCSFNSNYYKKVNVNKAIDYSQKYLYNALVGNLIGVELEYSKAKQIKINKNEYKVYFLYW